MCINTQDAYSTYNKTCHFTFNFVKHCIHLTQDAYSRETTLGVIDHEFALASN